MSIWSKAGIVVLVVGLGLVAGQILAKDAENKAADKEVTLKVGDPAPEFEATDDQGKTWKSTEHVGKKIVVVYFYPADCTGGCTKQAQTFRDDMEKLKDKGVEVVGVSGDSAENHQVFKAKEKLNYTLLADPEGAVARKFGAPVKKGGVFETTDSEGKTVKLTRGVTILRWTFVIGKDGKIIYKDTNVKPTEDSKKILELVSKESK